MAAGTCRAAGTKDASLVGSYQAGVESGREGLGRRRPSDRAGSGEEAPAIASAESAGRVVGEMVGRSPADPAPGQASIRDLHA